MKKAKIVMTAIAVLGVAAGAVAFKAKKAYGIQFWTGTTRTSCPNLFVGKTTAATNVPILYYTTTATGTALCTTARLTVE